MAKPQLRNKPIKKKANPLKSAKIDKIDYKDTALLRKFISDRRSSARSLAPSRTRVRWPCCPTPRPAAD